MTFILLINNVYFNVILLAVIPVDVSLYGFSCLFYLHSGFVRFSLHTDLLNLLVTHHFDCLSVYFIPL